MNYNTNITSMKSNINYILSGFALIGMFALNSCGSKNSLDQKKKELEKLKSEQTLLNEKIKKLVADISILDTTAVKSHREKIVAVTKIEQSYFQHSIDVQGRVDGDENIAISAKMGGPVTRLNVRVGDMVHKDQILAEIDNKLVRTQIADIKDKLALATDLYNKQKNLWDQKIGTEVQYLQAKNQKESLENALATLNENLDMYLIKSPISGTIDNLTIKLGQSVAPGMPCIQVVNFGSLKVKADLSESYSANVDQGDDAEIVFPDINRTLKSKVDYVAKAINPMTRTFGVEITLPSDNNFRPNMVAVVRIVDYKKTNALVIPINAIQTADGKQYVFVAVQKGKTIVAQKRDVKAGPMYNGKAEIIEGLNPGDQLISTGYQDLNDNEIIRF
jgi:RND family efflux transporter MFP subunit